MSLLHQAVQVLWKADFDMIRHKFLLLRLNFIPFLELFTLIRMESVIPADWLSAQEAKVSLPLHQCIAVLDDVSSLFWAEVFFPA